MNVDVNERKSRNLGGGNLDPVLDVKLINEARVATHRLVSGILVVLVDIGATKITMTRCFFVN